jgi:hypothetical protein
VGTLSLLLRFAIHSLICALGGPGCSPFSATTLFSHKEISNRTIENSTITEDLQAPARTTPIAPIARLSSRHHGLPQPPATAHSRDLYCQHFVSLAHRKYPKPHRSPRAPGWQSWQQSSQSSLWRRLDLRLVWEQFWLD